MRLGPLVCSFLGILFLTSAWSKLLDPHAFLRISRDFPRPPWLSPLFLARAVPILELILAAGLLGWPLWSLLLPSLGASLFLLSVSAAIAVRFARGEREFACGCAGDLSRSHSAVSILVRNACLLLLVASQIWYEGGGVPAGSSVLPVYLTGGGVTLAWYLAGAARLAWETAGKWKAIG